MATIEKRNGKYRVRVRIQGANKSATFERKSDALAWAAKMETAVLDKVQGNAPRDLRFADLLERYLTEITPSKRGSRSESYRIGRFLKMDLAQIRVVDLKAADFALWRDWRLESVLPDSVRRELGTLSAVCEIAVKEWGVLPLNPVRQISKPKKGKPRNYIPTDEEIITIQAALGLPEDYPDLPIETVSQRVALAMLFALETAMRAGEICNMTWDCVFLDRRVVHLPLTKNGHSRDVPLSRKALAILDRLPHDFGNSVFGLKATSLDVLFRKARDKAGVVNFHFHDTRHKALTRMAEKIEPMQLAKISGHKDLRTLMNVYYNPEIGQLADLLD